MERKVLKLMLKEEKSRFMFSCWCYFVSVFVCVYVIVCAYMHTCTFETFVSVLGTGGFVQMGAERGLCCQNSNPLPYFQLAHLKVCGVKFGKIFFHQDLDLNNLPIYFSFKTWPLAV